MIRGIERKTAMLVSAALTVGGAGSIGMASEVKAQEASPSPVPSDVAVNPNETSNEVLLKNPNTGECTLVVFPPMETPVTSPLPEASPTQSAEPTMEPSFSPEPSAEPTVEADYTLWQACNDGEQPVATETANPTEPPVVEPTPEVNITEELKPAKYFISREHKRVEKEDLKNAFKSFYEDNPDALEIFQAKVSEDPIKDLNRCFKTLESNKRQSYKLQDCTDILYIPLIAYKTLQIPDARKVSEMAYDYLYFAIPTKEARNSLNDDIKIVYKYY